MSFSEAITSLFRGLFRFQGRATRSEFWWALLVCILIGILGTIIFSLLIAFTLLQLELSVLTLMITGNLPLFAVPALMLGVSVRRVHDRNWRGWLPVICATSLYIGLTTLTAYYYFMRIMLQKVGPGSISKLVFVAYDIGSLLFLVSLPLTLILFVFAALKGNPQPNRFGPVSGSSVTQEVFG